MCSNPPPVSWICTGAPGLSAGGTMLWALCKLPPAPHNCPSGILLLPVVLPVSLHTRGCFSLLQVSKRFAWLPPLSYQHIPDRAGILLDPTCHHFPFVPNCSVSSSWKFNGHPQYCFFPFIPRLALFFTKSYDYYKSRSLPDVSIKY